MKSSNATNEKNDYFLQRNEIKMSLQKWFSGLLMRTVPITLIYANSYAQTNKSVELLRQKIESADSIELISHMVTAEFAPKIVPDWDTDDKSMTLEKWHQLHPMAPKYLQNGQLNRKIIIESSVLRDSGKLMLSRILLRIATPDRMDILKYDEPRNSIIFYRLHNKSYIDICFGCRKIHTSADINFSESDMDDKKWVVLSFRQQQS